MELLDSFSLFLKSLTMRSFIEVEIECQVPQSSPWLSAENGLMTWMMWYTLKKIGHLHRELSCRCLPSPHLWWSFVPTPNKRVNRSSGFEHSPDIMEPSPDVQVRKSKLVNTSSAVSPNNDKLYWCLLVCSPINQHILIYSICAIDGVHGL